jgi:hypothetical protein
MTVADEVSRAVGIIVVTVVKVLCDYREVGSIPDSNEVQPLTW